MHRQWHRAWVLADSATVCVNDSAGHGWCSATLTKSAAGADNNLDSGRSKACKTVTLAACVLAVGSWLVGEHTNAVAAVLMWGRSWPEHGIMGAPAVQGVRGSLYL
jgi:hypothetical protein